METLKKFAKTELEIEISEIQERAFSLYQNLLLEWNRKINLTAITDLKEIQLKHFFDSLTCLRIIGHQEFFSLVDIGTGAGFPGIPLKIILPGLSLTLIESVQKKADFCRRVVKALDLDQVSVLTTRVEEVGQDIIHREKYDWAVARAVADLPILVEYLLPLVKTGGNILAMKGANINEEIARTDTALLLLGGEIHTKIKIELPEKFGERTLVAIKKIGPTPPEYPRRVGVPGKKPLV